MITSPRRSAFRPPVIRHFVFTRLQEQSIAAAYRALIPAVSRYPGRPRSRSADHEPATPTAQGLRTKARGA
jgi:hypothetical protein